MNYSVKEAAKEIGISVRTMREWIKLKKIKAVKSKNGWFWLIPADEIARKMLERSRHENEN